MDARHGVGDGAGVRAARFAACEDLAQLRVTDELKRLCIGGDAARVETTGITSLATMSTLGRP